MILKIKKNLYYFPFFVAILISLAAAYRPLSRGKDVLADYSLITQDGFQWIIQGRALRNAIFSEPWPELRNPGYVFITYLDNIFGSFGLIISLSVAISLLIQIFVISYISFHLLGSKLSAGLIALATLLSPIQFISIHILSDATSVALMLVIILLIFKVLFLYQKISPIYFFVLSIFTPLFQLYAIYPIIIFIVILVYIRLKNKDNDLALYSSKLIYSGLLGLVSGVVLRQSWYFFIAHESSPSQFSLINFNFDNFYFYVNTWIWFIGPTLALSFFLLITKFNTVKKYRYFSLFSLLLFLFYALSIFFYSWQESRFSYFLTIFSFIIFAICLSWVKTENIKILLSFTMATLVLIFGSIYTPTDKWSPKIGESVMFRPWILHGFWATPAYLEYVEARNAYCIKGVIQVEVTDKLIEQTMPLTFRSDPKLGKFALQNCL